MITATIDIYTLELETGFSFDLVTQSQLWNFDKLRGACVPSISFPNTERNRAILGHPNRFESRRTSKKEFENFELRSEGYLLIRGTLVLQDGFSGFVRGSIGNLASVNEEKLITDYNLPEVDFENKDEYDPDTDDYCAPTFINKNFFKDISLSKKFNGPNKTVYEETLLQHYHRDKSYFINSRDESAIEIPSDVLNVETYDPNVSTNVVCPMLFLFPLINRLMNENNLFIRTNDISQNDEFNNLVVYNNYSIIELNITGSALPAGDSKVVTERYSVNAFSYYSQTLGKVKYKYMLPPVKLNQFLIGIQNILNVAFVITDSNRFDIIDRELVLIGSSIDIDLFFTKNWILGQKKDVVLEFKMKYDDNDEMFSSFYKDLSKRLSDFGDDVANISALEAIASPSVGELRRVLSENKIYEYTIETVTNVSGMPHEQAAWKFISIDFQSGKYNLEELVEKDIETIETEFCTIAKTSTPETMQVGAINIRRNSESAYSPRLIFNISNTAQNTSSTYFLGYTGSKNIISTRWPHTARFWANRQPVEGYFRFPAGVLASMINDVSTSGIRSVNHSKFSTRHGEFVIDKITTRFTHAGIGESKVEGWKVE